MKKRILLIATTPFIQDGLTKIELDVLRYNQDVMDFTIASRFGYEGEIGQALIMDEHYHCVSLPSKKYLVQYQKAIRKIVEAGDFDAVYIHGNSAMMVFEAKPSKKGGAKKVVTHCHNTKSNYPALDRMVKKSFNENVDIKIACSKQVADFAYDGNRVDLILNGPEIERFAFDEKKRIEKRNELGLYDGQLVIGHVGRFNPQKNHKKLIEIFEQIYKRENTARLLLIGEGELESEIKSLVKEKGLADAVVFLGKISDVSEYYHAMDAMVMPSLHEGLCLVALEAQANGMPLFLADTFSPETFACENAMAISLENSADEWANVILESDKTRKDNANALREKGLDHEVMMERIREALLK